MVSSRLRTTLVFFAMCGLLATSAFAGNLALNSTTFAHEIATGTTVLTINPQVYTMGIERNPGQNFILRFALTNPNVTFGANTSQTLTYARVAGGRAAGVTTVLRSGGLGASVVEFDVNVDTAVNLATNLLDTFTFNGTIVFAAGAPVGASTDVMVDARDVISALDTTLTGAGASYVRQLAVIGAASSLTAAAQTRATIDATVATPLSLFVAQSPAWAAPVAPATTPTNPDADTNNVARAFVTTAAVSTARNAGNTAAYNLVAADLVTFTITGDFTGVASVGIDLNNNGAITAAAGATTTTAESFTINTALTSATLTVDGDRLGAAGGTQSAVWFTKITGVQLNPRVFAIQATVNPTVASTRSSQARSIGTSAPNWFQWVQNGTTIIAPYVSFTPGNGVKFRFANSSSNPVNVLVNVVLDQGTFTQNVNMFSIPPAGAAQYTFSDAPSAGTGEQGPIATLLTGTQPVRGKVTFTALTASSNVTGIQLIYSPVGVVTAINLPQQGDNGWEK